MFNKLKESKYQFRLKFLAIFFIFTLIITGFAYLILYKNFINSAYLNYENSMRDKIEFKLSQFEDSLDSVKLKLLSIKRNQSFKNYLLNRELRVDIEALFKYIVDSDRDIFQIRYIGKDGDELVRVDRDLISNKIEVIAKSKLQNKFHRYYFKESLKLKDEEFYSSNLDLNIENGKIQTPYTPTIRISTSIFIDGKLDGVLIINLNAKRVVLNFKFSSFMDIYLTDEFGSYILHPDIKKSFSKILNRDFNLKDDFPNCYRDILNSSKHRGKYFISSELNELDSKMFLILKLKQNILNRELQKLEDSIFTISIFIFISLIPLLFIASIIPERVYKSLIKKSKELEESLDLMDRYLLYSKTDSNGVIRDVSLALCKLFGYRKDELIGKSHRIFRDRNIDAKLYDKIWSEIEIKNFWQGEIKNVTKNREVKSLFVTIMPEIDEDGKIRGYISIRQDLTDREKIEFQKRQLITQSKHAAMGEMISIISHQWKQPIQYLYLKIFNIVDKSIRGVATDEYLEENYESCKKTLDDMSKIIDDFRDFFKPNKKRELIKVSSLIDDSIIFLKHSFKSHNIDLKIDRDIVDSGIYVVKSELTQLFINIIKNSIDEFRVKSDIKERYIEISYRYIKDILKITISDSAGGIDKEIIDKIFEPYFSTKSENGTGIGLYMCKLIVLESLNGNIYVDNTQNGAKFTIKIPIKDKES